MTKLLPLLLASFSDVLAQQKSQRMTHFEFKLGVNHFTIGMGCCC